MATKVIYFTVNGINEQAEFRADDTLEDVKDVFRAAAEAGPNDILKLYNTKGNLICLTPKVTPNTPANRYRLEVVAKQYTGSAAAEMGFDITTVESRIQKLERKVLVQNGEMPEAVVEIKRKLDHFTQKLENVDHLSWLGLYKDISAGTESPFWNKQNNTGGGSKTNPDHCAEVYEKFLQISQVQVTDEVREYLKKPTFDNWQWEEAEMLLLLRQMYIDLGFMAKFNIEMSTLHRWLYEVYCNYNQVPFHNFKHCFMVTQMMYGLTWLIDLPSLVDDVDVFILITSAICHDLDHPGYNNTYQINAKTKLALLYNDISPLENHHCSVAFQILEKAECNILENLTAEQYKKVRDGIIKCILATDMSKHNQILHDYKAILKDFDVEKKEHKDLMMKILIKVSDISNEARPLEVAMPWLNLLLQEFFNQLLVMLVKAADISNEARPTTVSVPWAECLLQEFFQQSDLEKLEGLPVAPFMDRDKVSKSSSQVGFIKFVLLPLFEALGDQFPAINADILSPVREALEFYQNMQQQMELDKQQPMQHEEKNGQIPAKNGLTNARTAKVQ